jgi:uncharacterized damage-inducible protein DinB
MMMAAHPETPAKDIEFLVNCLEASREKYLRAVEDVSESSANVRIGESSWSILHCAEHVATAERQMLSMWKKLAAAGKGDQAKDAVVPANALNRERKNSAPERSRPNGRYTELSAAIADFKTNRANSIAALQALSIEDLRGKVLQHPLAGEIDGFQLFRLIAAHAERHAAQIEDIKNHPAYRQAG